MSPQKKTATRHRASGLGLVDAIMSIAIVSGLLVGSLSMLGAVTKAGMIQAEKSQGGALAQQLMQEILHFSYEEPATESGSIGDKGDSSGMSTDPMTQLPVPPVFGPESGESGGNRKKFDDVDDYLGWSASPPEKKDGTKLAKKVGYTRQVDVAYVDPTNPTSVFGTDQGLKRIIVTVTDSNGKSTTLTALKGRFGLNEQLPDVITIYLSGASVDLQVGANTASEIHSMVNFTNDIIYATQ